MGDVALEFYLPNAETLDETLGQPSPWYFPTKKLAARRGLAPPKRHLKGWPILRIYDWVVETGEGDESLPAREDVIALCIEKGFEAHGDLSSLDPELAEKAVTEDNFLDLPLHKLDAKWLKRRQAVLATQTAAEELRLKTAKANKEDDRYVLREDVERDWDETVGQLREELLALPKRLVATASGLRGEELQQACEVLVRRVLENMAGEPEE